MTKSGPAAQLELNTDTDQLGEKQLPLPKPNPKKQTQKLFRRLRQKLFPTSQEKEWFEEIQTGLEAGRRAAMLNIHKNSQPK